MKVRFFEKKVRVDSANIISVFTSLLSIVFLFLPDLCTHIKMILFTLYLLIIVLIYIFVYYYHRLKKSIKLKINNTKVNIFFGDIFKMEGKKVIAFNEYFDTIVDDEIIAAKSLNGQLVKKLGKDKIDQSLENDQSIAHICIDKKRIKGKQKKYELGTIHKIDDFFILAFTHFNRKNEAELLSNEYAKCLLEMWKQLNEKYAQEKIFIPLLGGGITRILDNRDVKDQELLEIMLNTLEISKLTFKKPSTINIVLYDKGDSYSDYNFAKIRYLYK